MNILQREINLFFIALTFLTRLPAPKSLVFASDSLNASARYYPLIGIVVGVITAVCYWVFSLVFTAQLSVLLSMVAGVLVTGAFHEDGFADCCDGFGGGWDKLQVLTIMKDSRVGVYGVVGIGLLLAVKFFALVAFPGDLIVFVLILAHCLSRLVSVSLLYDSDYVQLDTLSKVKPVAKELPAGALLFAIVSSAPLMLGLSLTQSIVLIVCLLLFRWQAARYLVKRIGGYTGDCLGAVQQLSEVLVYLVLLVTINRPL